VIEEDGVNGKEAVMTKSVLHRVAIIVATIAVGCAGISTDALARAGRGGGHFGHFGRTGAGHFGVGAASQPYGDYPNGYYGGCTGGDLGGSELDLGRRSRIDAYTSGC
jgi:hypothetical protein